MMQFLIFILSISSLFGETNKLSAYDIIKNMDLNLNSKNRVLISEMVIHGRRKQRKHSQRIFHLREKLERKC